VCFRFLGSCEYCVGTQLTLTKLPSTAWCLDFVSTEELGDVPGKMEYTETDCGELNFPGTSLSVEIWL